METTFAPLVSIVIPCYNYGEYVGEAIESILRQTYQNWELVVVNDGSTDNTEASVLLYTQHDSRVKYHYHANKGLSASRNVGIGMTTGKYIQLLDADDIIADDKLRLQVETLQNNPKVDLVYSDSYIFTHQTNRFLLKSFKLFNLEIPPASGDGASLLMHMAADNMFLPGAPLFRRSMHETIGGFKEDMFPMEDWHYWYRGLLQGKRFLHDNRKQVALFSRSHDENMSKKRRKFWENRVIAREAIIPLIKQQLQSHGPFQSLGPVLVKNQLLLKQETARYNVLYGKLFKGIYSAVLAAWGSDSTFKVFYETAYLLKERTLGRNKA